MLLFSRRVTFMGSPRKTVPWALEMTAYVNDHTPLSVSLWNTTFGFPFGTLTWTTMVESQAQLAEATAALVADNGYLDLADQAVGMVAGPGEDQLGELVYGAIREPAPVGSVAQVTTATAVVDQLGGALGFAVEIAQHVEGAIGSPVLVLTSLFGQLGGIAWIGVQPDMAAADTARAKMAADSTYLDSVTKSKGLFIPGSGNISQAVRIA